MVPWVVLAEAVIATVAGAMNEAPVDGDVTATEGAAGAVTEIPAGAEVVDVPLLPVAFAVIAYEPAATFAQLKAYGAVVETPSSVTPL